MDTYGSQGNLDIYVACKLSRKRCGDVGDHYILLKMYEKTQTMEKACSSGILIE